MRIFNVPRKISNDIGNLNCILIALRLLGCYTVSNLTIGGDYMEFQSKFCVELKSIVNSICRQIAQQPSNKEAENLTTMQIWIMHYLYDNQNKDVFQRDLEADFNIRRSTVSGILQILERKGYIMRQSVAHDARLKKITLTEEANCLYRDILQQLCLMEQKMTENILDEEWMVFYKVLEKIKENLNDM